MVDKLEGMMRASDIMSHPVMTVAPDTPVAELARMMVEKRISAVPVIDDGAMVGIVTEGDLLRRAEIGSEHGRSRWAELAFANWNLASEDTKEHGRKTSDVMTHKVITVAPSATLREVAEILEFAPHQAGARCRRRQARGHRQQGQPRAGAGEQRSGCADHPDTNGSRYSSAIV